MAERNLNGKRLEDLPDVPLDKIIACLEADDLRAFHQVSKSWKGALEKRKRENDRRLELVELTRNNKENISGRSHVQQNYSTPTPSHIAIRERTDAKKSDVSPFLMECTNLCNSTPKSLQHVSTPDCSNFQTPNRFEFQDFEEAEKRLQPGQKLFKCRRCRGPVPSPPVNQRESRRTSPDAARCKLISRMELSNSSWHDSPQDREFKKAKTLSSADLSPIPFSVPVTVASLEKMTQSLVLSSPCLALPTVSQLHLQRPGSSPDADLKRSTSCSSITTGIDLPTNLSKGNSSSINLSLNMSMSTFESPAKQLRTPRIHGFPTSCSRSCCGHIAGYATGLSDSNLSCDSQHNASEVYEFANVIPSPSVPVVPFSMTDDSMHNIERVRDIHDFSNSDGALSVSNFQFQRSITNSTGNSSESNPVLECPNPHCGLRFCSGCERNEHPGRPCFVLSSENFESYSENDISVENHGGNHSASFSNVSSNAERSRDSGRKKGKGKLRDQHKKSLRRIAKGP